MPKNKRRSPWMRRLAGFLWLAGWVAVLYAVTEPWHHLGGLVHERLRWLEWFVLFTGLPVGFTVGRFGRDAALSDSRRTYARLSRFLLYPPLALSAIGLVIFNLLGKPDVSNVILTALLAYWAGLDIGYGALPLLEGKSFRFDRPLDPEPGPVPDPPETTWVPPWERF